MLPFEPLESRFLLSVTLRGGTLSIIGTAGEDHIQLTHANPGSPDLSRTLVEFNGKQLKFKTSAIRRIFFDGATGDDFLQIGLSPFFNVCGAFQWPPNPYPFQPAIPTLLIGGPGPDTLIGGAGRDRIFGGDDADSLYGIDNNDLISGGAGDDGLYGGSGDDLLRGGGGDDGLQGGVGRDRLFGKAGNDLLDGDNLAFLDSNPPQSDEILGGAGDDTIYADASDDFAGGDGDDLLRYEARGQSIDGTVPPPRFDVPADVERTEHFYFGGECY
jgi:Ca2+-binding RTX toxin-like protein